MTHPDQDIIDFLTKDLDLRAAPDWMIERARAFRDGGRQQLLLRPTHEAADAFWKYWQENGETHRHGYYESTWGAVNAAIRCSGLVPHPNPPKDTEQ